MKKLLPLLLLAGCTGGMVDQGKVDVANAQLQLACGTAMTLSPIAGPYAPFILAGCGSAEGLARLAGDPASVAWVNDLILKVRALRGNTVS